MNIIERLEHIKAEIQALSNQCEAELEPKYACYYQGMLTAIELPVEGMLRSLEHEDLYPPPSKTRDTIQDLWLGTELEGMGIGAP